MRIGPIGLTVAVLGFAPLAAVAAAPPVQNPIAGQDVMGDKSRGGPDGFAQAPITRNQGASGRAPGESNDTGHAPPGAQPPAQGARTLPPGQDPGTPAAVSNGPGALDAATPAH